MIHDGRDDDLPDFLPAGAVHPAHVLVVDDDPAMRALLVQVLGRDGHTVSQARHGLEALAALQAFAFDVVLLDVRMPGLGGIEVLSMLPLPRPITLVMTGFPDRNVEIAARELGATAVLAKPFEIDDLRVLVASLLARKERFHA